MIKLKYFIYILIAVVIGFYIWYIVIQDGFMYVYYDYKSNKYCQKLGYDVGQIGNKDKVLCSYLQKDYAGTWRSINITEYDYIWRYNNV